jgi:hypothetical protein
MPGRYAKFEASSGLIASLERYAYESPKASAPASASPAHQPETADTAPEAPVPAAPADDEPKGANDAHAP